MTAPRAPWLLLLGLLAACGEARPRYRYVTAAPAATATGSSAWPGAQGRNPAPPPAGSGAAAPGSGAVSTPGSGSVATPGSGSPPASQAGPGGLSVAPATPLPAPTRPLSVGPGPVVGRTARGDVHEHLRDWEARDLIALDPRDARLAGDGLRESRELVAFYARREGGRLFLRVDLFDLAYGAELGGLDLVFLIGWIGQGASALPLGLRETTAHPWDAALVVRDTADWTLHDRTLAPALQSPSPGLDLAYRSDLDAVELSLDEAALQGLGFAGQPLGFQVLAVKDGEDRASDAVLEEDLADRRLDQGCREGWVAPRRAALSVVAVGNRAGLTASYLNDLTWSRSTLSREGFPTGLRRTLESHAAHRLPLDLHLSGVLAGAIGWAAKPQDPLQDGPALLAEVAKLWDGDPTNGEGAYLPGTFADALLPAVQGAPNQAFFARGMDVARAWLGVTAPGPVFWAPERVLGGADLDALRGLGFTHTVLDRTHLATWFGAAPADGKLHRINGLDCFLVEAGHSPFAAEDGGPTRRLRELLLERALDPDPQQVVVLVADWEEFAGHKGDPDVPDRYDRNLLWLAQRPWIEVATLASLAGRGWGAVDHGTHPALPVEAHEWLRHACQERYEHWYYGHPLEESFAGLRPPVAPGRPHPRAMGDLRSPGTLLGDTWAAVQAAPQGPLKQLAEASLAAALYRTAWHAEDSHDLTRLASGAYLSPDTSYDRLTGFVHALSARAGDAAVVAAGAGWAATPPAQPRAWTADVDLDGEEEWLLADERLLVVCERRGGRIAAAFARDPASGHAVMVAGGPLTYPSAVPQVDHEDEGIGAARNALLKDVWLTGPGRAYVNDEGVARVSTSSVGLVFTSSDGRVEKTLSLSGPGQLEVGYRLDPTAGRLYVRFGLAPDLLGLLHSGQRDLTQADDGRVLRVTKRHAGRTVELRLGYADAAHSARYNASASDGTPASPRNAAFQSLVELSGDAPGFSFSFAAEVR